jgi:hypothetical protein
MKLLEYTKIWIPKIYNYNIASHSKRVVNKSAVAHWQFQVIQEIQVQIPAAENLFFLSIKRNNIASQPHGREELAWPL